MISSRAIYLGLSNDSAHPSAVSLNRHLTAVNDIVTGLHLGPKVVDIENTVFTACSAFMLLIAFAREILNQNDEDSELQRIFDEYKRLVKIMADRDETKASILYE